jgi:hypothetical protein
MAAPVGNQNAVKAKRWQQAIDRALEKRSRAAGIEELDRLAEIFLDAAETMTVPTPTRGPSIAGLADLADRLDGKAAQSIVGPDGGPLQVEEIRRTIVDPG